jgi:hypothetical protein
MGKWTSDSFSGGLKTSKNTLCLLFPCFSMLDNVMRDHALGLEMGWRIDYAHLQALSSEPK